MANATIINTSKLGDTRAKLPGAVQSSRDTVTIHWLFAEGTPVNLTAATITGNKRDVSTGTVSALDGGFAVVGGAAGIFTWAYGATDVGTAGKYVVQFKSVSGGTTTYSSKLAWEVEETLTV